MKHGLLILAAVLALAAWLWFSVPAATEIMAVGVNPLRGILGRAVRLVTGTQEKAKPAALALRHTFPGGAGGLEGVMLAIVEHESGFVASAVNALGYSGPYQTRPQYFPDADVFSWESITPAIAVQTRERWNRIQSYTQDYQLCAALTYAAHLEGGQILITGLHDGVTWSSFCARVRAGLGEVKGRKADGWWNSAARCYAAAANAPAWQEWYDGLDFAELEATATEPA